jgi:hypothetical protein
LRNRYDTFTQDSFRVLVQSLVPEFRGTTLAATVRFQILFKIRGGDLDCREDEPQNESNREKKVHSGRNQEGAIMPSAHYETIAACLQENIKLLSDACSGVKPENKPLCNIGNALLALSDGLQDEFVHINTRLTYIEQQLNR